MLGRPQKNSEVERALALITDRKFDTFNIDLIYGGAGQTTASWGETLRRTLEYAPEEVFLYPLCATTLETCQMVLAGIISAYNCTGRVVISFWNMDMSRYRCGCSGNGARNYISRASYCCQEDGMVGIGSGARSYTTDLHYSSEYAVGRKVKSILSAYLEQTDEQFATITCGAKLNRGSRRDGSC